MWNLKNKTIVISGATNGIGKAAAIELSKENPQLLFTYRNQDLANELLAEIKALSPDTQVHSVYCDFSKQDSIKRCADEINDLCGEIDDNLRNRYDKIICLAVLEHVYNPFKAIDNINKLLKDGGKIYGMVPYLYHYHAPEDLKFQDYFRFSKDALSYLFKDFKEVELYPIRGKLSTSLNILMEGKWKKYLEKTKINIFFNKFFNKNLNQCSGYNFILKK